MPSTPVDPDAGLNLTAPSVTLSGTQTTATITASQLSFTSGRTLRIPGLPAGVTSTVNPSARTLTLAADLSQVRAGTTSLTLQYVTPEGQVLLSAPFTLTVTLPVPVTTPAPTPAPTPTPVDPDAGQILQGGSIALSSTQPSATITAHNLSFTSGRTLKVTNLPSGVSASVNTVTKTATLTLDPGTARSGTTTLTVQYANADGTVRLSAPYTLTISLPTPTPTPLPVDPDAGKTLQGGNLTLSSTQPSATIDASNLSFTSGRTLKVTNLPAGVTASINSTTRTATLSLDSTSAQSATSTIGVQYVNADGSVRLSVPYTLTVTLPAPAPAPSPTPAPTPSNTYKFTLIFNPGTDPRVQSAAQAAAAHWEKIITKSIGTRTINLAAQDCGNPQAYKQPTQDMVIFIGTTTMDGPGGILARSGPCLISGTSTTGMPIAAQLIFDTADFESLLITR